MPCNIRSTGQRGRVVRWLPQGLMLIALLGGETRVFSRHEVEIEHNYEENHEPVNPCIGGSVLVSASTAATTTTTIDPGRNNPWSANYKSGLR
jgi:hypothetical protein